jgi:hypothetical protein
VAVATDVGATAIQAIWARDAGMTAVLPHQAIGGVLLVPGNLPILFAAYLVPVAILVVFGIWGFHLGSKDSGGNSGGGGGPKRPDPTPTPPGGGKSSDRRVMESLTIGSLLEPPGRQEQAQERERELVGPRS